MKKYIVLIIVIIAAVAVLTIPKKKAEYTQEFYTVTAGDTLWSIAKKALQ